MDSQFPADHPQKKLLAAYRADYEAKFGPVSSFGGYSYDALKLVAQAIQNSNSAEPAAIRDGLEKINKLYLTAGEFNITAEDHCGLSENALVLVTIKKGDWEWMK